MTIDSSNWAMIISLAAAGITALAFIASFWFFVAGVKLQQEAQNALMRIEALAKSINERTGENFATLLDVVAGTKAKVSEFVEPGSPSEDKVLQAFDALQAKVEKLAARQIVVKPLTGGSRFAGKRPVVEPLPTSDILREKVERVRADEEAAKAKIQPIIDTIREMGPLTTSELATISHVGIQNLENMGLIEFIDGKWHARSENDE